MLELADPDTDPVRCLSVIASPELSAVLAKVARLRPAVADRYRDLVIELLAAKRAEEEGEAAEEEVAACGA